ncbi:uncharacterized protein LOC129712874 [Leucoraja erinacea]|uniref:uncharacterized protein LOC129712874 n=1 Tax=Leucoraja erinaceus TaxID=7782 RepID=UPI002456A934|nr:uncharacterized protein LOC129712874 [Leucoraja erinacea]XP_055517580.1 uncharacterized protein LOC129712874 [Leucoraja erinacea]
MDTRFQAVTLLALAVACIYFPTANTNIVPRCPCREETQLRRVTLQNIVDFEIIPSDAMCNTQIILTVKSGGEEVKSCLSPKFPQGKNIAKCWKRIQHNNNNNKRQCLQRKRQ